MIRKNPRKIGYRQRNDLTNCKEWHIPERLDSISFSDDDATYEEDEDYEEPEYDEELPI